MAPTSWAVALAETIMKRNPGTPGDVSAGWSYWKAYTLLGFEMLRGTTGDARYSDFIKRGVDPFVDGQGNLARVLMNAGVHVHLDLPDQGTLWHCVREDDDG